MPFQHETLAAGRWRTMSLAEQLGNIGGEVHRLSSWRERGQVEQADKAFVRMVELIDLTLADDRWRGVKRREIARVREALCGNYTEDAPNFSWESWIRYFDGFALLARAAK